MNAQKRAVLIIVGFITSFYFGTVFKNVLINQKTCNKEIKQNTNKQLNKENHMKLGAFSVSLNVKDIKVSKQFYENLGFVVLGGDITKNYLIMRNENAIVGLFQGMFQGNILTFNPGWDENANNIEKFDDVRKIQTQLKKSGIKLTSEADENTSGPASAMLADPDGNVIYIDQHR